MSTQVNTTIAPEFLHLENRPGNLTCLRRSGRDWNPESYASDAIGSPALDDQFVYYRGGTNGTQLIKQQIGGERQKYVLANNCLSSPALDPENNLIWYKGSVYGSNDRLWRCTNDAENPNPIYLHHSTNMAPVVGKDWIYFMDDHGNIVRMSRDGITFSKLDFRTHSGLCVHSSELFFINRNTKALIISRNWGDGQADRLDQISFVTPTGYYDGEKNINEILYSSQRGNDQHLFCLIRLAAVGAPIATNFTCYSSVAATDIGYFFGSREGNLALVTRDLEKMEIITNKPIKSAPVANRDIVWVVL